MNRTTLRGSGWTGPSLAVVIMHSLLLQVLTFCLRPTLTYAAIDAGLGIALLGLLSAAFALPGLIIAIPAGRLTDRFGERTIVTTGALLMVGATAVAFLGRSSAVMVIVATVLFGLGHLLSVVGDQAILANRTSPASRDSLFGAYAFSISLGQAVGSGLLAIGAGNSTTPDIDLQLSLSIGIAAACLLLATLLRSSPRLGASAPPRESIGVLLRRKSVLRAVIASSIVVTAIEIALVYFPALGYERGFPAAFVSLLLVVRSVAAMASRVGLGLQIRVIGRRRLMVGSIAVSAIALAGLAIDLPAVWIVVLCAVFGFSNGVCQPLTLSWLSEIAPAGQRGTLMSLRIAAVRISQTALPAAVGTLSAVTGTGGVLLATAALVGIASWLSAAIGSAPPPPANDAADRD